MSGIVDLLREILLDLADFPLQPEDNLMVAISRTWYNGSYTMTGKPIKSLELHYTMIQLLEISGIAYLIFSLSHHLSKRVTWFNTSQQAKICV